MKETNFSRMYEEEKNKPTPAQAFIDKCAELTCNKPFTVRLWLAGKSKPNALAIKVLAEYFGVDADTLFETDEEKFKRLGM